MSRMHEYEKVSDVTYLSSFIAIWQFWNWNFTYGFRPASWHWARIMHDLFEILKKAIYTGGMVLLLLLFMITSPVSALLISKIRKKLAKHREKINKEMEEDLRL